jgi:hypothetical protein
MIQFFASALLLGILGGAAVGFSRYGKAKVQSPAIGWAIWLGVIAGLFSATYAMSIPIYAHEVQENWFYTGLCLFGATYVAALLGMRQWLKRAQQRKK